VLGVAGHGTVISANGRVRGISGLCVTGEPAVIGVTGGPGATGEPAVMGVIGRLEITGGAGFPSRRWPGDIRSEGPPRRGTVPSRTGPDRLWQGRL